MKYLSTILLVLSLNILVIIAILFYQSILIEYLIESLEFEEAKLARLENKTPSEPTRDDFLNWMQVHQKKFNLLEIESKYKTFVSNHYLVQKLNTIYKGKTEFRLNSFADLSPEEFKSKVLIKNLNKPFVSSQDKYLTVNRPYSGLPDSFDWRDEGAVTPVKDQGQVGTCWAFSAVQNLEGQYKVKGHNLTKLSVEQVVDCDGTSESDERADCGVYGGWPYLALEYVQKAGGIESEESYSYCSGSSHPCLPCSAPGYNKAECGPPVPYCKLSDSCQSKLDSSKFVTGLKVSDWKRISEDEQEMAYQLMNIGPLSVALNAELLQFYFKGIFDPIWCNPKALNHAVLLVGWGKSSSKIFGEREFWIVKNSWGTKWGESGYFRIVKGKGKCGINTQAVTAVLE